MANFNNLKNEQMMRSALLERDPSISKAPSNMHIGHDFITEKSPYGKIEEKVAHLSLQINQIIVKPYLQQALDYLKGSKVDAINAYNQLSDQIANEVKIISQNTNIISLRLKEAQDVIATTQDVIRNKYNNATEEEISNCSLNLDYEYNMVAEHYELALQLTQELSKYKSRIDTLLASQTLLDESMVPSVSRIQLEIDNLELLVHSFDSSDYANILAKKQGKNTSPKIRTTPALEGRAQSLSNLAEYASIQATKNIESIPRVEEMRRYEDPNNQQIDLTKRNTPGYTYNMENTYNNHPPMIQKNYQQSQQPMMDNNYQQPQQFGHPMTRKEVKLQSKLMKQQGEIQRLESLRQQYELQNRQMQETQAGILAEQQKIARINTLKQPTFDNNQPNHVYEAQMPLETLEQNLSRSSRDKIFVVRPAEPISNDKAKELSKKYHSDIKTIKVIK